MVVESNSSDANVTRNESRITSVYTMHTRVPHLSELTWNRFLNLLPDRMRLAREPKLMAELRIPPRYIERIH